MGYQAEIWNVIMSIKPTSSPQPPVRHYRTSRIFSWLLAIILILAAAAFVTLTVSFNILFAAVVVFPTAMIVLAFFSQVIIDVMCGEQHLEIRRLKVLPPIRIDWDHIRDATLDKGDRLRIYLHDYPHPVTIETIPFSGLDADGLLKAVIEHTAPTENWRDSIAWSVPEQNRR
jgi:hypothetical protein